MKHLALVLRALLAYGLQHQGGLAWQTLPCRPSLVYASSLGWWVLRQGLQWREQALLPKPLGRLAGRVCWGLRQQQEIFS